MRAKKAVVVGELNVDLIFAGNGITPEPNREKLVDDFRLALGSSSAITAAGLAGLGCEVEFVSVVGNDDFGAYCLRELNRLGVSTAHVRVEDGRRTGVTLSLSDSGDRSLLTYMGTIDAVTPDIVPVDLFRGASHVHFGSYYLQESMRPHWAELFRHAKRLGLTTSFDCGWDPRETWDRARLKELLAWTDWFIPSEEEALQVFEADSIRALADRLPDKRGGIVVKRGAAGSITVDPAGNVTAMASFPVVPIDTTGAGDSFNAGWIVAMLEGRDTEDALRFANACGAVSTLAIGGAGSLTVEGLHESWPELQTPQGNPGQPER